MSLQDLDPRWDNQTLEYDLEKHNWPEFWLGVAKEKFPQIKTLETVHKVLDATELVELGRHLQDTCGEERFIKKVDAYYSECVPDLLDGEEWMLQRFFTIRMVIPNQAKEGRLLAFHQGIWVGNGLGLRTIWTPFTKCYGNNSMQIMGWEESDELTKRCYDEKMSYDELQGECAKHCFPVTLEPGQAHLFQQHHIHGNFNNDTDITRWSMDGRVLPKGGHYHRKLPGGYFRFIGERDDIREIDSTKKWISYAGWNTEWTKELPLPMQRAIISQYCDKHGIKINDYQFENEYVDWLPGLEKFITGYGIDAIVLCSINSLPDDPFRRYHLLSLAVENEVELHFANELCSVRTVEDIKHIQHVLEFVNENTPPNKTLGYV
jgi:sporadic carbohydrate cluster protein (TIGR04323 family)|tara:strand:+ start:2677 stop:3807 length:1131 start_codon:yes stop_codon:yes gene_type:complete